MSKIAMKIERRKKRDDTSEYPPHLYSVYARQFAAGRSIPAVDAIALFERYAERNARLLRRDSEEWCGFPVVNRDETGQPRMLRGFYEETQKWPRDRFESIGNPEYQRSLLREDEVCDVLSRRLDLVLNDLGLPKVADFRREYKIEDSRLDFLLRHMDGDHSIIEVKVAGKDQRPRAFDGIGQLLYYRELAASVGIDVTRLILVVDKEEDRYMTLASKRAGILLFSLREHLDAHFAEIAPNAGVWRQLGTGQIRVA